MSYRLSALTRQFVAIAMLIASLAILWAPGVAAQSDRGLIDETSYQSPQFGYMVTWAAPWETRERDVITNPGGFDTITLRTIDGTVRISGRADTYNPLTFLEDTIAIQIAGGAEIINQDTTGAVPTVELLVGQDRMRLDVISLPDAGAIVLVALRADQQDYDAVLASAQETIQVESTAVFGAAAPAAQVTEAPAAATQPAGATAPPVATQEVLGSGIEGNSYTSPSFGFSISWDPETWTVPEEAEYSEPDYDSLNLDTATGPLWVTGWKAYDGNPATCLLGEQTYYNDPETGITDWTVAVDADGNELTGESENSAWGVFTNVYTDPEDPNAEPQNFVDYIECVSLGDSESVVIFYSFARREDYNDHIGKVLTVIDSLELPAAPIGSPTVAPETPTLPPTEAPQTPVAATETPQTPAATTPAATESPATLPATVQAGTETPADLTSGNEVVGQTYPYRFTIPPGWTVNQSTLGVEIEQTTLTNGTSTVSVEARPMTTATLSDCVTNVAGEDATEPVYTDLELARTASGDPFSGEDDTSAFANFTFTGPDGAVWSHFVECQWIVEGQSALLVIQDVPQELFGSERAERRQIQNSIQIGS
jgi:hypothetical protein